MKLIFNIWHGDIAMARVKSYCAFFFFFFHNTGPQALCFGSSNLGA